MPSGYEKSPDYGGPEHGPLDWGIVLVLFVAVSAAPVACTILTRKTEPADAVAAGQQPVTPPAEQAAGPR